MEAAARLAGPGCGARGQRLGLAETGSAPPDQRLLRGLRGPAAVPVGGGRAWPGFETTRRAKLVARTASGRAGLAPPGSVVVEVSPGSVLAKMPPGSVVAKLPRGSEAGRNSASGGVEVEEGD